MRAHHLRRSEGAVLPYAVLGLAILAIVLPPVLSLLSTTVLAARNSWDAAAFRSTRSAAAEHAVYTLVHDRDFLITTVSTSPTPVAVLSPSPLPNSASVTTTVTLLLPVDWDLTEAPGAAPAYAGSASASTNIQAPSHVQGLLAALWDEVVKAFGSGVAFAAPAEGVLAAPSMSITASVSPTAVCPSAICSTGATSRRVTYTVTHSNGGPDAGNVTRTDFSLPSGFSYVSGTTTGGMGEPSVTGVTSLRWNTSFSVAAGTSRSFTFQADSSTTPGSYSSSVSTSGSNFSTVSSGLTATVTVGTVVTITKAVDQPSVEPLQTVVYTITLANSGSFSAPLSNVVDTLPTGFAYVAGSSKLDGNPFGDPKATGQTFTWDTGLPSIAAGGSARLSFTARAASAAGIYTNAASTQGPNFPSVNTGATAAVLVGAKMAVTKAVSPTQVIAGDNVVYTITVSNQSTTNTPGAVTKITDTLPSGFSYVGPTTGAITANPKITGGTSLEWTTSITLDPGASFSFSFTAMTNVVPGTYLNQVTLEGSNFPAKQSGPTAALVTVGRIQISKTVTPANIAPSQRVAYTITVQNVATSGLAVTISKISDTLPPGQWIYVSGTTSGDITTAEPKITGNTLVWDGTGFPFSLAAGGVRTLIFNVDAGDSKGTFFNNAEVSGHDPNGGGVNFTVGTGDTAPVTVSVEASISISEGAGDKSGPPGWSSVFVKGFNMTPNKEVRLYWTDPDHPFDPTANPPAGTSILPPGFTIITLSQSEAPLSFDNVQVSIPSTAAWGRGYIVAAAEEQTGVWVEQDRKPFFVRAKWEVRAATDDGRTLIARVLLAGKPSANGRLETPSQRPTVVFYQWHDP